MFSADGNFEVTLATKATLFSTGLGKAIFYIDISITIGMRLHYYMEELSVS